jgi:threonine dehydrogenase-like Zn-dependent dehydrogenase
MCEWLTYDERGILRAHGFMAERFVEAERYLVPVPATLGGTGVLLEPLSVVEKAFRQASLTQRRIASWEPRTAVVLGAGPIGLLQTMLLRERGAEVWTLARSAAPTAASRVVEACGAHYLSTGDQTVTELAATLPRIDLIIEATGVSALVAECMAALGANGVLVLLSITGHSTVTPVPLDAINRGFVLGNKVMLGSVNSAHEDFMAGVARLSRFEERWPGLTESLITHRLDGLDQAAAAIAERSGIKTVVELPA